MNAKARTARQIINARKAAAKAAKAGQHSLTSHAIKAGLDKSLAGAVAGALRAKGKALGILGKVSRMVRRTETGTRPVKNARRFTKAQFLAIVAKYSPRAARFVAAKTTLLAY